MRKKQKDNQAVVGAIHNKPEILTNKRQLLVLLMAVVVMMVGGLIGYRVWSQNQQAKQQAKDCSQKSTQACSVLREAVLLLDPAKAKDLSTKIETIKSIKDYENDPNLIYVLTVYYINLSDGINARKYLNLLKSKYNSTNGYDPLLSKNARVTITNLDALEAFVNAIAQQEQNYKANFRGITGQ